jgi:polyisoprenoid-binding protein YceI
MTYRSKKITITGGNRLHIDGELDLHGIKQPVALDAIYNGGYAGHPRIRTHASAFPRTAV